MKYETNTEKIHKVFEKYDELEQLLTERISDLHEIKGMMQARHAYIFYRKLLCEMKEMIVDSLKEVNK